jgi:ribonuclease E
MFSPFVTLRSGGYLVINQTEALVAIDINSGKSTREHSIEETALKTNLEAADEIARQLRLRDLAGLIVIDFIDMEERRNNRQVERRLKEALRFDRARIQVGRISHFGLLEMSRQRMRTGVLEGSTTQCPHCQGTGVIRSTESVSLAVLRGLEDALLSGARGKLVANTSVETALYLLNSKRHFLHDMEERYGITISINGTDTIKGANFTIERVEAAGESESARKVVVKMEAALDSETVEAEGEGDRKGRRKRKRRRGRDRGDREEMRTGEVTVEQERDRHCVEADEQPIEAMDQPIQADLEAATLEEETRAEGSEDVRPAREENGARKRRRGRRGGRRNRRERDREHDARLAGADGEQPGIASQGTHNGEPIEPAIGEAGAEAGPLGNGFEYRHPERDLLIAEAPALEALPAADQPDSYEPRPDEQIQPLQPAAEAEVVPEHATKTPENEPQPPSSEPPRRGWWQRRLLG